MALLAWPLVLLTAVDEEETDEVDEMEEEELFRGMVFRGISTPLTSSEFIELRDWPPLSPHAGRLMFAKLGGLATAVMRKNLDMGECAGEAKRWQDEASGQRRDGRGGVGGWSQVSSRPNSDTMYGSVRKRDRTQRAAGPNMRVVEARREAASDFGGGKWQRVRDGKQ